MQASFNDENVDYGDEIEDDEDEEDPDRDGRARAVAATSANNAEMTDEDRELEAMKARVREMEAEAAKLREMQAVAEKEMAAKRGMSAGTPTSSEQGGANGAAGGNGAAATHLSEEEKQAIDGRSIFVGNVSELFTCAHAMRCLMRLLSLMARLCRCRKLSQVRLPVPWSSLLPIQRSHTEEHLG